MYYDPKNKTANINYLRSRMISVPFSEQQQDVIYSYVKSQWLFTRQLYMNDHEYIDYVLLPEVFQTWTWTLEFDLGFVKS